MEKIPKNDLKDWEEYLQSDFAIEENDEDKFSQNEIILEIDLHGYNLDKAFAQVKETLLKAKENNIEVVKFITGIGKHSKSGRGEINYELPFWLKDNPEIRDLVGNFKWDKENPSIIIVKVKKNNI
jgi:DNA-nicking Smr family endonuclease